MCYRNPYLNAEGSRSGPFRRRRFILAPIPGKRKLTAKIELWVPMAKTFQIRIVHALRHAPTRGKTRKEKSYTGQSKLNLPYLSKWAFAQQGAVRSASVVHSTN